MEKEIVALLLINDIITISPYSFSISFWLSSSEWQVLKSICTRSSKTGFFRMICTGLGCMVIGIDRLQVLVKSVLNTNAPVYLPTVDVLDHDVVWWLTKFFCKIVTASVGLLHTFFLNRKQLLWLNRKKTTQLHLFLQNSKDVFYEH